MLRSERSERCVYLGPAGIIPVTISGVHQVGNAIGIGFGGFARQKYIGECLRAAGGLQVNVERLVESEIDFIFSAQFNPEARADIDFQLAAGGEARCRAGRDRKLVAAFLFHHDGGAIAGFSARLNAEIGISHTHGAAVKIFGFDQHPGAFGPAFGLGRVDGLGVDALRHRHIVNRALA